jgi:hypothetical protein
VKLDKITAGMTLYDVGSHRMGNTTMRTMAVWPVFVKEVDTVKDRALVSWNGNAPEWRPAFALEKLRAKEPVLIRTVLGARRLPTREELKEIRAKAKAKA